MIFKNGEWVAEEGSVEATSLKNIAQRTRKISQSNRKPTSQEIRNQNMQNEYYKFAYDLVEHIKEQMEAIEFKNLIFRNKQGICYDGRTKQVKAGYWYVDDIVKNGFHEYKTVCHVWSQNGYNPYRKMTGKQAVWAIMLHEFAHHFQWEEGGFSRGSIHNSCFCKHLNELIVLFPYEEVKCI